MRTLTRGLRTIAEVVLAGLTVAAAGSTTHAQSPTGWYKAGSHPREYDMAVDRVMKHGGSASATIRCKEDNPAEGFGTLMQSFKADGFRGKRLRLTGYVKSDSVADWAGLWMRVDSLERTSPAFDNMGDRKIEGTTDWTKYTIVLDVPEDASAIAFGLLMRGKGQVWLDDLSFEVVGPDVATTDLGLETQALSEDAKKQSKASVKLLRKDPRNLGFES